jgi:hypothetical protein
VRRLHVVVVSSSARNVEKGCRENYGSSETSEEIIRACP